MRQFAPVSGEYASYFEEKNVPTVLSLKAETHNFPTTVEPLTERLQVPAARYATV